jgi:hypothetical protein
MHTDQLVQIAGAILILTAFIGAQAGRFDPHSRAYLVLNILGAGILAVIAAVEEDWGFLLLEGVWTAVSAWSLVQTRAADPQRT